MEKIILPLLLFLSSCFSTPKQEPKIFKFDTVCMYPDMNSPDVKFYLTGEFEVRFLSKENIDFVVNKDTIHFVVNKKIPTKEIENNLIANGLWGYDKETMLTCLVGVFSNSKNEVVSISIGDRLSLIVFLNNNTNDPKILQISR